MASVAVLAQNLTDMLYMEKHEVSKRLFAIIPWEEVLKSGVFLEPKDVSFHKVLSNRLSSFGFLELPKDEMKCILIAVGILTKKLHFCYLIRLIKIKENKHAQLGWR